MKKKVLLFLSCFFVSLGYIIAQTTVSSGTVIDGGGEPVIGASVSVKGTTVGTITDIDGEFTLNVPKGKDILVFSLIGLRSVEHKASSNMQIVMEEDSRLLDEVVVTALGIKRSEKALGFAATNISSEDLTKNRSTDLISGLSGRVAGVQIAKSSQTPGSSTSVVIRGFSSLSGNNQPLYIIDGTPLTNKATYSNDGLNNSYDFGNGANAINPEDIASMTILKGAAATALYGSRAANGAIIITTKSGDSKLAGLNVEYNGGMDFSRVYKLPKFQNEYGMGWNGNYTTIENGSWGPRFDGSMQVYGPIYNNSQLIKPYVAQKNNLKEFFDTGVQYTNSVSLSGSGKDTEFFGSFSQLSQNGIYPTNADENDRYTFALRGSHKVKDLTVSASMNYANQVTNNVASGQGMAMMSSLYQTPRDISLIDLKDLNNPFNSLDYYYTPYGVMNPYQWLKSEMRNFKSDRLFGNVNLNYSFLKFFNLSYRLGLDLSSNRIKEGSPNYSKLTNPNTINYQQNFKEKKGRVSVENNKLRELNHDFILTFDMPIQDFHINAIAGFNANERKSSRDKTSISDLDIPTWFNLSNSASTPLADQEEERRRLVGVFGQAELGYKSLAYLTVSARNDWSSTLPKDNNSFFYPGVTGSLIFTELIKEDKIKNIISFGKLRLAWGQTGNDASPYMIEPYYEKTDISMGFGRQTFPFNGINGFTLANRLGNNKLQPEITTETEAGLNFSLLKGRISVDAAYYNRNSNKQIFTLDMDPATGYNSQTINLGKIRNRGVELLVNVRPIEINDFSWDVAWNFTKNNSKVISLPPELGGTTSIFGLTGGVSLNAIVGYPIGTFKSVVPQKTDDGKLIVDNNGLPIMTGDQQIIGNINYDYEMGISSTFKYKWFSLSADFDFRHGGLMYSNTKNINYFVGNAIQTTYNERNTFIVPNSVYNTGKLDNNGKPIYAENVTPVSSENVYKFWNNGGFEGSTYSLIDKSYVKLRSVVLGFDLPKMWLKNTFIRNAYISIYGTNLFVWTPNGNTFVDPETSSFGNDLKGRFGEYNTMPSTRNFGFNVKVKF